MSENQKKVKKEEKTQNGKERTSKTTLLFFTVATALGAFVLSYQDDEDMKEWTIRVLTHQRTQIVIWTTFSLFVFDMILAYKGLNGRYYILHTVTNGICVILTFEGMLKTIMDPMKAGQGVAHLNGYLVVTALHIYHVVAFPLNFQDWLHHFLMIGIVGPITFKFARGPICDYCSFFISGLPGGIDYAMLSLVKNGRLSKMVEKRVNAAINTWIRVPFTVIGGFILFQFQIYYNLNRGEQAMIITVALLVGWNAVFYGRRVIENYGNARERGASIHAS
jgi:hypothetical protein